MKNRKFWGSAGLLLLTALTIITVLMWAFSKYNMNKSGIQEGLEYEEYRYHFAMIVKDGDNNFWRNVYENAREGAKEADAYLELMGENVSADYTQADYIRIAAREQVDGILLEPDLSQEAVEEVELALKAGIPVVTLMEDVPQLKRQCFVGVSNYNLGQEYGKQLRRIMGEETADILVLMSSEENTAGNNLIFSSIKETVGSTGADIQAYPIKGESIFSTEEAIHNIIMNKQKVPDILVCLNSVETECAYQAVVDYNKVGEIDIIGFYDSDITLEAITKDIIHSTIAIDTKQLGELGVRALIEYITMERVSDFMPVDIHVIDRLNVGMFLDQKGREDYE